MKNSSNPYLRIEALEYLVVTDEHRHGLHGKQCVELTVECRLIKIIKDEFGNLRHAVLVGIIHILITVVIFHFLVVCPSATAFSTKDRRARKSEHLRVVEELHDVRRHSAEMASDGTRRRSSRYENVAYFNTTAIPLTADSGIEFLNGCYDNL